MASCTWCAAVAAVVLAVASAAPGLASNITFKGDLRYRYEAIDQQFVPQRNRHRIRVRVGLAADVGETLRTEFRLATSEDNDPRSSNVTLTGQNSRKDINLDLAYVEWRPGADWRLVAGKMRGPWVRPGHSLLIDGDINPEGLAAHFAHGDFFAGAFYNLLEEHAADNDSALLGGQAGWKHAVGASQLTLGAGYYDYVNVQGRNPFFGGPNGNTVTDAAGCRGGITTCLVHDYDIVQLFAEWSLPAAGRPLAFYADAMRNLAADNGLDTAWSAGVTWGRASDAHTWEVGYVYQLVQKDAVFGQLVDSDFGGGNTDARGSVVRFGYAPAKNWVINAWYHFGQTNLHVPASIPGIGPVHHRDYQRLQLDLNFRY